VKKATSSAPHFRGAPVDLVVDVRSKIEFWMGHLPGAVCIPVDDLPEALTDRDEISSGSRILLYCATGARSATAAAQLRAAGFKHVVDGGGLSAAWSEYSP
jgi:rhodanese-related sulfurtransferase